MKSFIIPDSLANGFIAGIVVVFALSPLLLAWYEGLGSPRISSFSGRIVGVDEAAVFLSSCASQVRGGRGGGGAGLLNFSRLIVSRFAGSVSTIGFILSGIIGVWIVARPLELRYFFVELLFTGSRLKLVFARLAASLAVSLVGVVSSSLLSAFVLLVAVPGYDFAKVFPPTLYSLLLSSVSGIVIASALSLGSRSTSGGILGVIGFAVAVAFLASKFDWLRGIVNGASLVFDGVGVDVYAAVVVLSILFTLWRSVSLEY